MGFPQVTEREYEKKVESHNKGRSYKLPFKDNSASG